MSLKNTMLFALCSIIWGTTWLVIKFQINSMDIAASVFFRFLIAGTLMLFLAKLTKPNELYQPFKNHQIFIAQGLFNFCLNYILTYISEINLNSAYIALTFTLLIYFNMIGLKIWFKKTISPRIFMGGILGGVGLVIIFYQELKNASVQTDSQYYSIVLGIIATFFASVGNMFGYENHIRKIPVVVFTSYGMLYGSLMSLIIAIIRFENLIPPSSGSFWGSLIYLSILGTLVAFWSYQTLVGSIGADKAAFTSIISPIIAVVVSSFFENLQINVALVLGAIICLTGNYISLRR